MQLNSQESDNKDGGSFTIQTCEDVDNRKDKLFSELSPANISDVTQNAEVELHFEFEQLSADDEKVKI